MPKERKLPQTPPRRRGRKRSNAWMLDPKLKKHPYVLLQKDAVVENLFALDISRKVPNKESPKSDEYKKNELSDIKDSDKQGFGISKQPNDINKQDDLKLCSLFKNEELENDLQNGCKIINNDESLEDQKTIFSACKMEEKTPILNDTKLTENNKGFELPCDKKRNTTDLPIDIPTITITFGPTGKKVIKKRDSTDRKANTVKQRKIIISKPSINWSKKSIKKLLDKFISVTTRDQVFSSAHMSKENEISKRINNLSSVYPLLIKSNFTKAGSSCSSCSESNSFQMSTYSDSDNCDNSINSLSISSSDGIAQTNEEICTNEIHTSTENMIEDEDVGTIPQVDISYDQQNNRGNIKERLTVPAANTFKIPLRPLQFHSHTFTNFQSGAKIHSLQQNEQKRRTVNKTSSNSFVSAPWKIPLLNLPSRSLPLTSSNLNCTITSVTSQKDNTIDDDSISLYAESLNLDASETSQLKSEQEDNSIDTSTEQDKQDEIPSNSLARSDFGYRTNNYNVSQWVTNLTNQEYPKYLYNVCYKFLRTGACWISNCRHKHFYPPFFNKMELATETEMLQLVHAMKKMKFVHTFVLWFDKCLQYMKNNSFMYMMLKLAEVTCDIPVDKTMYLKKIINAIVEMGMTFAESVGELLNCFGKSNKCLLDILLSIVVDQQDGILDNWPLIKNLTDGRTELDFGVVGDIFKRCVDHQPPDKDFCANIYNDLIASNCFNLKLIDQRIVLDYVKLLKRFRLNSYADDVVYRAQIIIPSQNNFKMFQENFKGSQKNLNTSRESINTSQENLNAPQENLGTFQENFETSRESLKASRDNLNTSEESTSCSNTWASLSTASGSDRGKEPAENWEDDLDYEPDTLLNPNKDESSNSAGEQNLATEQPTFEYAKEIGGASGVDQDWSEDELIKGEALQWAEELSVCELSRESARTINGNNEPKNLFNNNNIIDNDDGKLITSGAAALSNTERRNSYSTASLSSNDISLANNTSLTDEDIVTLMYYVKANNAPGIFKLMMKYVQNDETSKSFGIHLFSALKRLDKDSLINIIPKIFVKNASNDWRMTNVIKMVGFNILPVLNYHKIYYTACVIIDMFSDNLNDFISSEAFSKQSELCEVDLNQALLFKILFRNGRFIEAINYLKQPDPGITNIIYTGKSSNFSYKKRLLNEFLEMLINVNLLEAKDVIFYLLNLNKTELAEDIKFSFNLLLTSFLNRSSEHKEVLIDLMDDIVKRWCKYLKTSVLRSLIIQLFYNVPFYKLIEMFNLMTTIGIYPKHDVVIFKGKQNCIEVPSNLANEEIRLLLHCHFHKIITVGFLLNTIVIQPIAPIIEDDFVFRLNALVNKVTDYRTIMSRIVNVIKKLPNFPTDFTFDESDSLLYLPYENLKSFLLNYSTSTLPLMNRVR